MRFLGFVVFSVGALACTGGSPAEPSTDASFDALPDGPEPPQDAGGEAGFAVCPPGIQPSFKSIHTLVFNTSSCGVDRGTACHSSGGAGISGGLDFSAHAYTNLLGDGGGAPAVNISGHVKGVLKRVIPGDPAHSFLVIKLSLDAGNDYDSGSGMPFTDPGSVCPETLDAIKTWIMNGATNDEADAGVTDAGPG